MDKNINVETLKSEIHLEARVLEETLPVVKVQYNQEIVDMNIEQLVRNIKNMQQSLDETQVELDVWQGRKQKMIDGGIYEE